MTVLELLCQVCALALFANTAASDPSEEQEALRYLLQFGYLQKPLERLTDEFTEAELTEAMRSFQLASELPPTGLLDDATLEQMRQPRCGVEDPFNQKTHKYLLLGRWRRKNLTYRIYRYTPDMATSATRQAIQAAFRYWSDVAPLTFREVRHGPANIRISFHGAYSWTCSRPFDGPGKVLAHADVPEEGTVHFDEDELWTEGTYRGVNLRIIAAHEIGHALGLGHSRYPTALMAPVYSGYRPHFRLHFDDIDGIRALYGKKTPPVMPSGTLPGLSPTTPSLPPTKVPDPCTDGLDALMFGPYEQTYAFRGGYVWTVTDFGTGPLREIPALWKGLPGHLDAAVHSPRTARSYFFKGDKVWRYRGFELDPGYPKALTRVPAKIDAAFYWPGNKKIFLFKGTGYWQWDEVAWSDFGGYPRRISKLFTGVPSHLDAAMAWENGRVYFFKGGQYWRVNAQLRVERGYPLSTAEHWMHCKA
ncbi:matrix metalloproteinase-19 [Chelonoidis abingdonii]|uniref:matrix metalloproteinase-19 n=1 Tax=Chelonoidis abingdonii TaxID=106734 RepID=UPI0013F25456|nr:matrix metalloproteinase-19 [Chelonoidis abingdonii]